MILQSMVLYSLLILVMFFVAELYSLKQTYQVVNCKKSIYPKSGIIYLIFIILFFSLMMGLRYNVGTDYLAYQKGYIYNIDVGKGEFLFNYIRKIFNRFELHYAV